MDLGQNDVYVKPRSALDSVAINKPYLLKASYVPEMILCNLMTV